MWPHVFTISVVSIVRMDNGQLEQTRYTFLYNWYWLSRNAAVKPFLAEGTTEISFSFNEKATYHFVETNLLLGRRQGPGVESCLLCIEVSFSTEKYMLRSRRSSTAATDCLIFQGFPVMRDCMQRKLIVGKYAQVQVAKLLFTESQLFLGFSEKYI